MDDRQKRLFCEHVFSLCGEQKARRGSHSAHHAAHAAHATSFTRPTYVGTLRRREDSELTPKRL